MIHLKNQQVKNQYPTLYRIVTNAVRRNKIPHAYLIAGQHHLKQLALWMSSVLTLASVDSEQIDQMIENIQEFGNEDVILLDGEEKSIKKEEMIEAMRQLNLTSKQTDGVKTLIVHHVDHGSPAALNAFLKSLEEPSSNDVHFILTTDNVNQVLPTILSRCLVVNLSRSITEEIDLNEEIQSYVESFLETMDENLDRAIVELQLLQISDRHLLEQFFYKLYQQAQKLALDQPRYLHLATVSNAMLSKITRSVNPALLIDEFGYRMKEEIL